MRVAVVAFVALTLAASADAATVVRA